MLDLRLARIRKKQSLARLDSIVTNIRTGYHRSGTGGSHELRGPIARGGPVLDS
jgi:hypothetical protein